MKPAVRFPFSFLTGGATFSLVLVALGMAPASDDDDVPRRVWIMEGECFVVPDDRILTVRTIGSVEADSSSASPAMVAINGKRVFGARAAPRTELVVGLDACEGDTVEVEDDQPNQTSVLLGFLAEED